MAMFAKIHHSFFFFFWRNQLPVYKRMSIDISARNSPTPSTSGTTRRLKSTSSTGSNGSNPSSTPTKLTAANPSPDTTDNNNTTLHVSPHRFATISGGMKAKTLHRHSTGTTVRPVIVKPSTTSASTTMLPRAPLAIKPVVNNNKKETATEIRPPAPLNNVTVANGGSVENESKKESKLQKPSYMGPGSTLRLRSMMAKRNASNI